MNNEDRFQKKCDQYLEFVVHEHTKRSHPKKNGKGHMEHELADFKNRQRYIIIIHLAVRPDKVKMLDDVHPGILDHIIP